MNVKDVRNNVSIVHFSSNHDVGIDKLNYMKPELVNLSLDSEIGFHEGIDCCQTNLGTFSQALVNPWMMPFENLSQTCFKV